MDLVSCLPACTKAKVEDTSCAIMDTKTLNQEWCSFLKRLILIMKSAEYLKTHLPKESPRNIEELKSEFRKYPTDIQLTLEEILKKFSCFLCLIECEEVNLSEGRNWSNEMKVAASNLSMLAGCEYSADELEKLKKEIDGKDIINNKKITIESFIKIVAERKVPTESLEINNGCCYKLLKKEEGVRKKIIVRQVYSFSEVMEFLFLLLDTTKQFQKSSSNLVSSSIKL